MSSPTDAMLTNLVVERMRAQFPRFLAKGNARELRMVACLLLATARKEDAQPKPIPGKLGVETRRKNRLRKELAFSEELKRARGDAHG